MIPTIALAALLPIALYLLYCVSKRRREPMIEFYGVLLYLTFLASVAIVYLAGTHLTILNSITTLQILVIFFGIIAIINFTALLAIYKKTETQRINITELTREVSYKKEKMRKRK